MLPRTQASNAPHVDISGNWYNQHGSRLSLVVLADGKLEGRFTSRVGLADEHESFELVGFLTGDLVAFTVDFGRRGSLTSWVGHVTGQGPDAHLDTLWQMTVTLPAREAEAAIWKAIWSGADVFGRELPSRVAAPGRTPSHPVADPRYR